MKVSLEELRQSPEGELYFEFEAEPTGLTLKSPAHAALTVKITGAGFINITGTAEAELIAVCDNCLKEFTLPLNIEIDEFYAENTLYEEYKSETEIKDNFFAIDLEGAQNIDLTDLIYQSLILSVPNKLVCDINCNGDENINKFIKKEITDPRLEVFKEIQTKEDKRNGSS